MRGGRYNCACKGPMWMEWLELHRGMKNAEKGQQIEQMSEKAQRECSQGHGGGFP